MSLQLIINEQKVLKANANATVAKKKELFLRRKNWIKVDMRLLRIILYI